MDRRAFKRIPKRLSVKFGLEQADCVGFSQDMSPTSIFIKTTRPYRPGTLLKIQIVLPDERRLDLTGKVVWAKLVPPSLFRQIRKSGMGVRLEEIPQAYIQFVSTLL
jgi:Tfp pilus assembly protein PilZ